MSLCPYTWVVGFVKPNKTPGAEASQLRVRITKNDIVTVDVTLPAGSARWLIDLIPEDVMTKIRAELIPIDSIQDTLAQSQKLFPQDIFELKEPLRQVKVWLD